MNMRYIKSNINIPARLGLRRDERFAQQPQPRHDADLCSPDNKFKKKVILNIIFFFSFKQSVSSSSGDEKKFTISFTYPDSTGGTLRIEPHRAEDWLTLRSSIIRFCSKRQQKRK